MTDQTREEIERAIAETTMHATITDYLTGPSYAPHPLVLRG